MIVLVIIEKCKRPCACNSVTQKHELMRQIKSSGELIRFSNQLRFRHTFGKQKMNESCWPEKALWTLKNITSVGGYNA